MAGEGSAGLPVAPLAPALDLTREYSWLVSADTGFQGPAAAAAVAGNGGAAGNAAGAQAAWEHVRLANGWVEGQGKLESMFAPEDAEDILKCADCFTDI